ncbi:3016_t:CDS:1, partial [Ambispora gerdemannii]
MLIKSDPKARGTAKKQQHLTHNRCSRKLKVQHELEKFAMDSHNDGDETN